MSDPLLFCSLQPLTTAQAISGSVLRLKITKGPLSSSLMTDKPTDPLRSEKSMRNSWAELVFPVKCKVKVQAKQITGIWYTLEAEVQIMSSAIIQTRRRNQMMVCLKLHVFSLTGSCVYSQTSRHQWPKKNTCGAWITADRTDWLSLLNASKAFSKQQDQESVLHTGPYISFEKCDL